jgi:hypothetical protein
MKVGCIRRGLIQGARSTGKNHKKLGFPPTIDHFVDLFFKNQWGLYGGDLNGFLPIFCKSYFKKLTSTHGRPTFSKSPWIGAAQIRSFDSCAAELSSEYRSMVGDGYPKM